jgi:hypothetical protein
VLDDLLLQLLHSEAARKCEQCAIFGDCTHNAARALLQLIDLHEQGAKYAAGEKQPKANNIDAPKIHLGRFNLPGLKASCRADSCDGIVMIGRFVDTLELDPKSIWCVLCGQRYTIDTKGLSGVALEGMLRGQWQSEELISLREAAQQRIRYMRKPAWQNEYIELPLVDGGWGPWFTLHSPWAKDNPDTQGLDEQKILYTDLDLDERAYISYDPEDAERDSGWGEGWEA